MSFSLVNPSGWVTGDTLTETQINQLDTDHSKAIDGTGGGTYTLTAPLLILGDSVEFDDLTTDTFTAQSGADIFGTATVTGALTVTSHCILGTSSSDLLSVSSTASFLNDVSLGSSSADDITLNGVVFPTGDGRILNTFLQLPNTDTSINVLQIREARSSSSATRVITTTGSATEGDHFTFYNHSGFTQTITGVIGQSVPTLKAYKFVYLSGAWTAFAVLALA